MSKRRTFEKADRFEVRCKPALRQLADKIQSIQDDPTFAATFRGLVVGRAKALMLARSHSSEDATAKRALRMLLETVLAEDAESAGLS